MKKLYNNLKKHATRSDNKIIHNHVENHFKYM